MALEKSFSHNSRGDAGFSLVETLVAIILLTTALVSTAQLFVIATRANMAAQKTTFAATLAHEKMEQLRGLAWGFDDLGLPISDFSTDLTTEPPVPNGGAGLAPSPGNSLSSNVDGYVDYVDRFGTTIGGGMAPPDGTVYVRRWSIEPLPTNPNNTLILQVLTFSLRDRDDAGAGGGALLDRRQDEARLVSVKTRKSR
jgi:type II secretory pathway pseudopilin PulG